MRAGPEPVDRLAEAVQIAELTFGGASFDFDGNHYEVFGLLAIVATVQQPHPPITIGGEGAVWSC